MIDLHCHIIDGTGCGPDNFQESVEMCGLALKEDVRTIVATPRWDAQSIGPPLSFTNCHRKLKLLHHEMSGELTFKLGFMMQFRLDLPELLERYGSALTLGGGHRVLVSLPSLHTPPEAEEVWGKLARLGFSILLAHPECSLDLRSDSTRLELWVAKGLMLQIDAASVMGAHGREVQRFAIQCVRKYENHVVVASNSRDAGARSHSLGDVRKELARKFGSDCAENLVMWTPKVVLDSERNQAPLVRPPRRSLYVLLRSARARKPVVESS